MKALRSHPSHWREIAEHEAARVQLQAEVELARLVEEGKHLEERHVRAEKSLDEMGVSEARLRAHDTSRHWWGGLAVLAIVIAGLSAWWSVGWYLTLGWEKVLVAVTVVVLPLIGSIAFLRNMDIPERDLRRLMAGLGLAILLASAAAGASLALGRMIGTNLAEEQQVVSDQGTHDLDRSPGAATDLPRVRRAKRLLAVTSMIAVLFLGIASEAAAGIAFDEFMRHGTVVRTVKPLYREREWLEERLAENAYLQEAVRRRGKLALISRTIDGLNREEAEARAAIEAAVRRDAESPRPPGLGSLVRKVAIPFAIALIAALAIATWATGAERELSGSTVVLVDLSVSTASEEFSRNLRAVEGVIRRVGEGGRLTVLGITEASFSLKPLLQATAPRSKGRFGEHLGTWRESAIREWRETAAGLRPAARGTDIFGALTRAAVECEGVGVRCQVVILSDMRQVGRGVDLERSGVIPVRLMEEVRRRGLVPQLRGVSVWALGVHTVGFDERQWQTVRAFWTDYFRIAGADLVLFSPNRRIGE